MKSLLALCALLLASFTASAAATYTFTGANYDVATPFTAPCATGSCANFSLSMHASGTFSGPSRLAPNLPGVDITAALTGFSFTDGVTTYSSTDAKARVYQFIVTTDANGDITAVAILLERWQTAGAAHVAGDRFDFINITGTGQVQAQHNFVCTGVGVSPGGTADSCLAAAGDASSSTASAAGVGAFAFGAANASVPTLGECALLLLAALMGIAGVAGLRRKGAGATAA
jgi:hypothetical protein